MASKSVTPNTKLVLVSLSTMLLRLGSIPTADLSYFVLAAYALLGRSQAIQALALSWLFNMLNLGMVPEPAYASAGRFAVIVAASASVLVRNVLLRNTVHTNQLSLATWLLGGFLICHSILFSPVADVSVLKAISWTLVTATLFTAWSGLSEDEHGRISNRIFDGLVIVLLCSLPLFAVPELGYLINGTGFQGIFNHPQLFGPTMALLGAWAGARMLGEQEAPWRMVLLTITCLILAVLSQARTGGVGMVLGLSLAVLLVPLLANRPVRAILPGLMSRRVQVAAAVVVVGAVLNGSMLLDRVDEFLAKGDQETGVIGAYNISRGGLMDMMFDDIELHPLTGIGFGNASGAVEMFVERDPVLGLPLAAPIEKGVLPIAVLQEVGIFGAVAVLVWLWMVLRSANRAGVAALALVFTSLLLNFGESTFFSPSGFGLLPLILISWAATGKSDKS